jgi:hypothetical protein
MSSTPGGVLKPSTAAQSTLAGMHRNTKVTANQVRAFDNTALASSRSGSIHMLQRAWVGDMRAARMAGRSPAMAPMTRAEASPPAQASGGITVDQCLVWA